MMKRALSAILAASILTACAPPPPQKPVVHQATGANFQQRLTSAAGLTNIPKAAEAKTEEERQLRQQGLYTITNTINPVGGLGVGANLTLGLIGFFASPPLGPESRDRVIALASKSKSPEYIERKIQDIIYKDAHSTLKKHGYKLVPSRIEPHLQVMIKPGCTVNKHNIYDKACSIATYVEVDKKGSLGQKNVYHVTLGDTVTMRSYSPYPNETGIQNAFRVIDRSGGLLHLYVAPRPAGKAYTKPFLYSGGKKLPL